MAGTFITLAAKSGYLKSVAALAASGEEQSGVTQAELTEAEKRAEAWVRQRLHAAFSRVVRVEDQEEDVDPVSNEITAKNHGLRTDDAVRVSSSATLPAPLAANTTYYVIVVDEDTIQLAASAGGAAIDLTDDGEGTMKIRTWVWTSAASTPAPVRQAAEMRASAEVLWIHFMKGGQKEQGMSQAAERLFEEAERLVSSCRRSLALYLDDGTVQERYSGAAPSCAAAGGA